MKGGGFFRRVVTASLAFAGVGPRPAPLAVSHSQSQAQVPQAPTKTPAPAGISARDMQNRVIKRSNVWRSYVRSHVIPPFKFCHGRTMVARYPRVQGS
jgi:hypothetical protein